MYSKPPVLETLAGKSGRNKVARAILRWNRLPPPFQKVEAVTTSGFILGGRERNR